MKIINIDDFRKRNDQKGAIITFRSIGVKGSEGEDLYFNISVNVGDGDVIGVLNVVKEDGGIWAEHNGAAYFIPWSCVIVEIPAQCPESISHSTGDNSTV